MKRGHWAFVHIERIVGLDGAPYLTRLRVVQTPLGGLYLHRIHREDWDRHLHSHPWTFASVVLRGGYVETVAGVELVDEGYLGAARPVAWSFDEHTAEIRRWRPRVFPKSSVHRIVSVRPNTWTLVAVGRRRDDWGFYVPGRGMVRHDVYLREQGHPQAGAE